MSRIGRKPILVPPGVKVQITAGSVEVQGPKVKLSVQLPPGIHFEQNDGVLIAVRQSEEYRAMHGLARALVANAVQGITQGFKKELLNCSLGYSHPIVFPIPDGIQITVDKQTHVTVTGADKALVGQVAADLRSLRPPDPYKQKGIRLTGERLKKKAGKAGAAKTAG